MTSVKQAENHDSPELAAALEARRAQRALSQNSESFIRTHGPMSTATSDPLPFCVWTTIAVLAWLLTPPLVVTAFGLFGLKAYISARRKGLKESKCVLGDTRIVIFYLALCTLAGFTGTIMALSNF